MSTTTTTTTPPPKPPNTAETKRLFAQLTAFLDPLAHKAGLTLRPFSLTTFTGMQLAGIAVGSDAFATMTDADKQNQLVALLAIQTAPLSTLKDALRTANGDFQAFYWNFVFEFAAAIPLDAMLELESQLATEMPAIEATQIEVQAPASADGGKKEKPPGE
jgi:hypothetical protein